MARGQGLEHTKEYRWVIQPNGRYSILDIPIFETFNDEKRGEVSEQDLQQIVHNFQEEKLGHYHYPRVHIGHHEGIENREGAGYMDYLRVEGNMILADLVEITPEVFQAIRDEMQYPYVSAEYHSEKQKILSLALLQSQPPFFSFPLLKLAENQTKINNFSFDFPALGLQESPEDMVRFQDVQAAWAERSEIIQFQETFQRCGCMDQQEKKPSDEPAISTNDKGPITQDTTKQYQQESVGSDAKLDRIIALLEKQNAKLESLFSEEEEEHENLGIDSNLGEGGKSEPSQPMKGEEPSMKKPSSVAYQAPHEMAMAMSEMAQVQKEMLKRINRLEVTQNFSSDEQKLKMICETRGLSFQEHSDRIRKFSTINERNAYMSALEITKPQTRHSVSGMVLTGNMSSKETEIIQKYQGNDQVIAREAWQTYQSIASNSKNSEATRTQQEDAIKFEKSFSHSPERFVDYVVKQYPYDSNVLERLKRR